MRGHAGHNMLKYAQLLCSWAFRTADAVLQGTCNINVVNGSPARPCSDGTRRRDATMLLVVLAAASALAGAAGQTSSFPYSTCGGLNTAPYTATATATGTSICFTLGLNQSNALSGSCSKSQVALVEIDANVGCVKGTKVAATTTSHRPAPPVALIKRNNKAVLQVSKLAFSPSSGEAVTVCVQLQGTCSTPQQLLPNPEGVTLALVNSNRSCCNVFRPSDQTTAAPASQQPPQELAQDTMDEGDLINASGHGNATTEAVDAYNLVLGTQQFYPAYQLLNVGNDLKEAAVALQSMGSNIMKLHTDLTAYRLSTHVVNGVDYTKEQHTLEDVFKHPDMAEVLSMPFFKYYLFWTYVPANRVNPRSGFKDFAEKTTDIQREYEQMYAATVHLLTTYKGSGKTFFLGNWEGDWHLLQTKSKELRAESGPAGMLAWFKIRQQAVDDAKAAAQAVGVEVYHYMELNQVQAAVKNPETSCLTTLVLPYVDVDFVSYSSYESLNKGPGPATQLTPMRKALKLLQAQLRPKVLTNGLQPGTPAPYASRVFIGEYGYPTGPTKPKPAYTEPDAAKRLVELAKVAMEFRLPFMLYWQLYNNLVLPGGIQKGWWLIDNTGRQTAMYKAYHSFLTSARGFVAGYAASHNGQLPSPDKFAEGALKILQGL